MILESLAELANLLRNRVTLKIGIPTLSLSIMSALISTRKLSKIRGEAEDGTRQKEKIEGCDDDES